MAGGRLASLLVSLLLCRRANCAADDTTTSPTYPGCRISLAEHLRHNSRLILHPHSNALDGHRFLQPAAGQSSLSLEPHQQVVFACPLGLYESARCVSGSVFEFPSGQRKHRNITDITCRRPLRATVRNFGRCHNNELQLLGAGLMLHTPSHEFIRLVDFCFDPRRRISLYAKFTLMQGAQGGQRGARRPNSTCSSAFHPLSTADFEDVYSRRQQYSRLVQALGSRSQADKFLDRDGDRFLVKGLLAAFRDFVFLSEQQVAALCVNAAPMWHVIRRGNWRHLEDSIRSYASRKGKDLTVYSGTYDVLALPSANGTNVPVYLGAAMPVPELFWKIVYDRLMRRGIVFVGINNPDEGLQLVQYQVCDDVCHRAQAWFAGWNRTSIGTGYIYCCAVRDFLDATDAVPEFRDAVLGLLT